MKTQLLEDIGLSAEYSLSPAASAGHPQAADAVPGRAGPEEAGPADRRAAAGVWRQKPAGEPAAPVIEAATEPAPQALHEAVEDITAPEAQFVLPVNEFEVAAATVEARHAPSVIPMEPLATLIPDPVRSAPPDPLFDFTLPLPPSPTQSQREPALRMAEEDRPAANPASGATLTQDPVFDFTPPATPPQAAPFMSVPGGPTLPLPPSPAQSQREPALRMAEEDTPAGNPASGATLTQDPLFDFTPPATPPQAAPFMPVPSGPARSRQSTARYLLWGACLLAGGLLIQGGRWLYQERSDAGSLALVAGHAREVARVDRAIAAKEATPEPVAGVRAQPIAAASTPLPAVPPLVMLKPEEYTETKVEPASPPVKREAAPAARPKPQQAAKPRSAPAVPKPSPKSSPKPSSRKAQAPSVAAAVPAKERRKREPVKPPVRAATVAAKKPARPATATAATLKACRERGYGQAQCIKRGCSVSQHGFSCRAR